ncbi:HPr family phosphocarrier protein [Paenibacillus hexagrammi]|uniref:HPr family phosphocarrier protein n=1 Tax=Paenibacillus hexagrammi TaxID=2908839 RepID=A0ABY3SHR5_9BACL|nr:HPr family phosphocarrier protein [Paenibacillus sp. YPD9-1]UJF33437.1 HPr family phosphocarrier protein [Paenibacillus sp. YPD9-1]
MGALETKAIVAINQTANQFQSSIVIQVGGRYIDVKSILGLSITLFNNQAYELYIQGPDEEEARAVMKSVFEKHGFTLKVM